ncbi:LPXTG cell wall anchor domain-containing protein [Gleimia hominis]|uniref:LPXTG cell wall anchor domain-containing protein n=1 Tax=Gleimia hominis TaxID=595468 RepID=A0ABU3I8X4_9ACTO|nr:LPXTG cell wall anchor domain-containing protein [Gleimia hominis]MDT3766830.1 LPXTG cell wall anchor domain-containing protein [Gleimia hominis]
MTNIINRSGRKRWCTLAAGIPIIALCATFTAPGSLGWAATKPSFALNSTAPSVGGKPAEATDNDSNDPKWSGDKTGRYGDVVRKIDRVAYVDGGAFASPSCDVTGDGKPDMIFANSNTLSVVDHIPYGDPGEEVSKNIAEETGVRKVVLPLSAGKQNTPLVTCVSGSKLNKDEVATPANGRSVPVAVAAGHELALVKPQAFAQADAHAEKQTGEQAEIQTGDKTDDRADGEGTAEDSAVVKIKLPGEVTALTATTSPLGKPLLVVAMGSKINVYSADKLADLASDAHAQQQELKPEQTQRQPEKETDAQAHESGAQQKGPEVEPDSEFVAPAEVKALAEVSSAVDGKPNLAAGIPSKDTVLVFAPKLKQQGVDLKQNAQVITATPGSEFGAALTATGDLNEDGRTDLAVGAPGAWNNAGAVALVNMEERNARITVDLAKTEGDLVVSGGQRAGSVLRQNVKGRFGISVAWVDGYGQPGALLVGRPVNDEHAGALLISQNALTKDWVRGQGVDHIPGGQWAWFAATEDANATDGTRVGIVPRRGSDHLTGIYTADARGKVDVWTVDMSRQAEKPGGSEASKPSVPQPANPTAEPAMKPVNEDGKRSWLGEFTSGFGGAIARGACDVTGDGVADIVASTAVRSEWKFDPYYADTETKGWVFNVTGQLQVIPGQTPGGTLPQEEVIQINGPVKTQDPAVDANIGLSVACAGDVNGDKVDDIVVGSHTMGRVWVLYGGKGLRGVDLNDLDPAKGFEIHLPTDGSPAFNITRVGDVDGDGKADVGFVVANSRYAMGQHEKTSGTAFVIKGGAYKKPVDMTDLYAPNDAVLLRIDMPNGHTMNSFTRVGDVNGDGVRDWVVTDFNAMSPEGTVPGKAWVVYGAPLGDDTKSQGGSASGGNPGAGQARNLDANRARSQGAASAAHNHVINGRSVDLAGSYAGYEFEVKADVSVRLGAGTSVAHLGDLDGDGTDEFAIGFDGGEIMNTGSGGFAIVYGVKDSHEALGKPGDSGASATSGASGISGASGASYGSGASGASAPKRVFAPSDPAALDKHVRVVTGGAETGLGYSLDARPGDQLLAAQLAVGAANAKGGGRVYRVDAAKVPEGISKLEDLGGAVQTLTSPAEHARFGRAVAFSEDVKGMPMLLVGGDGVIDEPPSESNNWEETQGYAHAAHILALRLVEPKEPDTGAGGQTTPGGPGSGVQTNPGSGGQTGNGEHAEPGQGKPTPSKPGNTKPGNPKPGNTQPGDTKPGNTKPGNTKPGNTNPGYSGKTPKDKTGGLPATGASVGLVSLAALLALGGGLLLRKRKRR